MAFIQLMQIEASDIEALEQAEKEWLAATEGKRTVRREILGRDRNNPDSYVYLVFFDSYEAAMENSNLPETQEIAAKMQALAKSVSFVDLDVVREMEG